MKNRNAQPEFAVIDWQGFSKPLHPLEVSYSRVQDVALGVLVVILGGPMLIILTSRHLRLASFVVVAFNTLILFTVLFLRIRAKRKAVRRFDAEGIVRGDGRRFGWKDFRGVVNRTRRRTPSGPELLWRAELVFADGETAWLIPQQVKNSAEVFAYLRTLPQAREKSRGEA